ncbi:putative oxidoreductase,short chain dehydrogenase [Macrophomina phaseolina]|uniref:Oxidoreductase,short chain dehydrogenase n=1 Tax=Macrophomina phaseolina TaxID=35725 RepID=A0ABQ8FRM3_9PEZI|nr:putative oxidoreductase,short chain dehydrogenase [Macrophomina phaseolina]
MSEIIISSDAFETLKDKIVVITGGSSGIGLAAAKLAAKSGAKVLVGDVNPLPTVEENSGIHFVSTDVTSWNSVTNLFEEAQKLHGKVDHVFANAGIAPRTTFLEDVLGDDGKLQEPDWRTLDVNLKGVLNTVTLGLHHIRKNGLEGGSIVVTASVTSYTPFEGTDYGVAKHGIWGFMRCLALQLTDAKLPIRINAIAPSWTASGMVDGAEVAALGGEIQTSDAAARSALFLMADDGARPHGLLVQSHAGRYKDVESAFMATAETVYPEGARPKEDGATLANLQERVAAKQ